MKKMLVILLSLTIAQFAKAAVVEQSTLEIGYHGVDSLSLKKVRGQQLENFYLVKSFSNGKSRIRKISGDEYKRRKTSLFALKKKLGGQRQITSTCPQFVRIKLLNETKRKDSRYCISELSLDQNKAVISWWDKGGE